MSAMEPMKPMKPMAPMKPMTPVEAWWPDNLGQPTTAGSQNGTRYAFFPHPRRLLIERNGRLETYDTASHQISGVSQQQSHGESLTFASQDGPINLDDLRQV